MMFFMQKLRKCDMRYKELTRPTSSLKERQQYCYFKGENAQKNLLLMTFPMGHV